MDQHVADRNDSAPAPVAVVGMSCRFPGGIRTPGELWNALREGRDLVTEVPPERFDSGLFVDPRRKRPGKSCTAAGGFLDDIEGFDAGYFGIAPREAARMDPQQRLLLETAVEALDDAGMRRDAWSGTDTGVFIGASSRDFGELQTARPDTVDAYTMTGLASSITANRISHFFDWHGESIAVDTACSSALTAVHRACAHLRTGAGPAALAGGVNVLLNPFGYAGFSAASMLSPTGRCRPFAAAADGFVRAEAAAVVVLRRLADALADGDRIRGVLLATGVNCDGRTRGLALPRRETQQALLERLYAEAGIDPDDLVYFEAHGTGTPAGDPVECEAIGRALGSRRRTGALPIGSVKSNLGHSEAASGMAGLLKALLVLEHGSVPPTLHAEPLHPGIDFGRWRLRPAVRGERLAKRPRPVVGVNSFGFGGANAHAVLAPPPVGRPSPAVLPLPRREPSPDRPLPVVVTAHTRPALAEAARRMADRLATAADEEFYDIARTAYLRRTLHEHRVAVLAARPKEAADGLMAAAQGRRFAGTASGHAAGGGRVAFAFSGNGSQWPGMCADLLAHDPVFRAAVHRHDAALRPHLGWSVADVLAAPVSAAELRRTEVAQPLLYAAQMGLVAVLAGAGVRPAAVLGHSVGEIAAACAAGVLDEETAARVVAGRGRAQAPTAGKGRMAAVGLPEAEARAEAAAYDGRLTVAAVNSARDVTLAGDPRDLEDLGGRLASRHVFFRVLDVDHAFHSPAMDPVEEPLRALLDGVRPGPGTTPFFSSVTGGRLPGAALDAAYWWRNVREPVLFAAAARAALDEAADLFVEIGPHPVTAAYLSRFTRAGGGRVPVVRTCVRHGNGPDGMRTAVAQLLACGARAAPEAHFPRPGRVVSLPAVPWQRERHWNGAPSWWSAGRDGDAPAPGHPLLGPRLPSLEPSWSGPLEASRLPWLGDHRVGDGVVLPAAAYLEAAFAAAGEVFDGPVEVLGLRIDRALSLPWEDDADPVRFQLSLSDEDGTFRAASRRQDGGPWQPHARGRVRRLLRPAPGPAGPPPDDGPTAHTVDAGEHYARAARAGLPYGPAFRVLDDLRVGSGEVVAAYATGLPLDGWRAHPVVLDGALQACLPLLAGPGRGDTPYLPVEIGAARLWLSPPATGRVRVRARGTGAAELRCDITLLDTDGRVTAELEGVRLRRFPAAGAVSISRSHTVLRALSHPLLPHPAPDAPLATPDESADAAPAVPEREHLRFLRFRNSVAALAADAVRRLLAGTGTAGTETFTLADLAAAGVRPRYVPLLEVLLALCEEQNLLLPADTDTGRAWRRPPGGSPPPRRVLEQAFRELPEQAVAQALYARCMLHLPDVVRGRLDARELLFAEADRHLVDQIYASAPYMESQLAIACATLRTAVARWPADRPLRVLEVGAGTGAMTGALLDVLPAERTEYVFTDGSAAFLHRARRRFEHHAGLGLRTFDIDEPYDEQGFLAGEFDVIVAHHALHVARDLRRALGRLAELLADGGLLLATEMHDTASSALCFGLLEEFWSHTDTGLRPSSPLMSAARWKEVLDGCGFTGTRIVGQGRPDGPPDASVLLARRAAPAVRTPEPAVPRSPGDDARWILVTEGAEDGRTAELAGLLAASGARGVRRTELSTDPDRWAGSWRGARDAADPVHVVCLLDDRGTRSDPEEAAERAVRRTAGLAAFARALTEQGPPPVAALWLVTASGAALPAPASVGPPEDAAAWAAARCLGNEHPALAVRRIAAGSGTAVRRLALELLSPTDEDEVVLTRDGRFVPRLTLLPEERPAAPGRPFRAEVREPGLAHRVHWTTAAPPPAGPDDVLVEVRAAGLNYRDVMESTGLLRPGPAAVTATGQCLGLECAGIVTAVGSRVTGPAPGDRVYAMAPRSLASHAVADRRLVARMPDGMDFAAAATLPVVFLTVQHGLERLAHLTAGETLLVHGAAGGVGLAALQHARAVGARVIATAGTPAKRDLLRQLGVEHVFDSRGLDFAERVRGATGGQGVDVVLNSLAGEALVRGAELLRPGGRFVELGKRDIDADSRLPMSVFDANVSFLAVDLGRLLHAGPVPEGVLDTVAERVRDGVYRPLPYRSHPAARLPEAMTALRHSRHLGKVVVTFDAPPPVEPPPVPAAPDPAGAYLVAGGLTGLGAAFARHLAERGARHLVLLGRRGAATPGADTLLDDLAARGARAEVHAVDICDREAVTGIVRGLRAAGRPLRGVVHAAAVFDDAPLALLTEERVRGVLRTKALGGLVLDAATAGEPLDFFVCCSSASALVGNRQQAHYAAGNLFLESLVRARRAAGRPGLAVAWGVIDDTGHVAREDLAAVLRRTGLGPLTSAEAYTVLEGLLVTDATAVMAGRFDWARAAAHFPALGAPRFTGIVPPAERDRGDGAAALRRRLAAAEPDEALELVAEALRRAVADVLRTEPERVDRRQPLDSLGLDSLMAAELVGVVSRRLGCEIPAVELLDAGSVDGLARRALERLGRGAGAGGG